MRGNNPNQSYEYDTTIKPPPTFGASAKPTKPSRINRMRWWLYSIGALATFVAAVAGWAALIAISSEPGAGSEATSGFVIIAWWGYVIFQTILNSRRFHDMGMSGWHAAWGLIPMIGSLIMVGACGFPPGENKANKWGAPRT